MARVALDVGAARTPVTGVAVYISELARALGEVGGHQCVRIGIRANGPLAPVEHSIRETQFRGRFYARWILQSAGSDAVLAECALAHFTNGIAPLRPRMPFVLTVHDLSIMRMPRAHPLRRLALVPLMLSAVKRAARVIVPSAATASELSALLGVASSRIAVIPLAARQMRGQRPPSRIVHELGLTPRRYIVAIGTLEPRKNHVRLIRAFERVASDRPDLSLVLVGARGWRDRELRQVLRSSSARSRIRVAGHVDDAAVSALLASSAAMAYPSLYEGFGLPILEAMAGGAPVVTSNVSSMREVAGNAAVLVDPLDVASIASGLRQAIERREELVALGRARSAERSWRDVALDALAVYDEALNDA